jgi:hypothetical protein
MTICNYCNKPICEKNVRFVAILPIHTYQWIYYHNECFVGDTPPHRIRGSYQLTSYPI